MCRRNNGDDERKKRGGKGREVRGTEGEGLRVLGTDGVGVLVSTRLRTWTSKTFYSTPYSIGSTFRRTTRDPLCREPGWVGGVPPGDGVEVGEGVYLKKEREVAKSPTCRHT